MQPDQKTLYAPILIDKNGNFLSIVSEMFIGETEEEAITLGLKAASEYGFSSTGCAIDVNSDALGITVMYEYDRDGVVEVVEVIAYAGPIMEEEWKQ